MLPGIISQVSLDWSEGVDYYIPTIKRYKDKIYLWIAASGPQLGGPKEPGASPQYWQVIDTCIVPHTVLHEEENWDDMKMDGKFLMQSLKGISVNPPIDITSYWWLDVSTVTLDNKLQVLQVARKHTTDVGGSAQVLSRVYDGTTWGSWSYNYSQYAG